MEKEITLDGAAPNDKLKRRIDDAKVIIDQTIMEFHNNDFRKYIENYKRYLGFVHERLRLLDDWQTNVDYPLVASVVDTMFGNLFDFGYEFGVNEVKLKDLCTKSFDFRNSGRNALKDVTKEVLITGKGFVKPYLLKEEMVETFFDRKIEQTIKIPSLKYVSVFDVMYDRSKGLADSPFHIVRTFVTGKEIERRILPALLTKYPPEQHKEKKKAFKKMLNSYKDNVGDRFSLYDYNPVKMLANVAQMANSANVAFDIPCVSDKNGLVKGYNVDTGTIDNEQRNNYFLNANSSTYELVEYNDDEDKIVFVNGNLIWFGKRDANVFNIQEAEFSRIPGTGSSNGLADNLGNLQDINNMLWNSFLDNIKLNLGPMFKITGNLPMGKNGTLDFKKFRTFRTNGSMDIEKIQLGSDSFAPMQFMQLVETTGQQRSGVSNYIMGGAGAVERVSGGIDMKFNQYKSKLTPITDSIDQMMGNVARSWILMFFKYFTKDELGKYGIEITESFEESEDGKKGKFQTILVNGVDIRNIIDESSVSFTYNSLDRLTKENSRKILTEAFPAMAQYMPDKVNMDEFVKVFAGEDFDPSKIIVKAQEGQQQGPKDWSYDKPYLKGSSQFMPPGPEASAPPPVEEAPDEGMEGADYGSTDQLEQEIANLI